MFGEKHVQTVGQQHVQARALPRRTPHPRAGRPRQPHHALPKATRRPRRAPSPCAAPRGSSESSRALARRVAPYRPGACRGPLVCRRHPAICTSAEVAVLRRNLRRHRNITGEVSPIKTERPAPPCTDTAAHRATRAAAGASPPLAIPVSNPRLQHIL
jgi:hypothetical protein